MSLAVSVPACLSPKTTGDTLEQGYSEADTESWEQGPWSQQCPGGGGTQPEGHDLVVETRDQCCVFWSQLLALSVTLSGIRQ